MPNNSAFANTQIDFRSLGRLPERYREGQRHRQQQDLRNEFSEGLPRGPNGEIDYNEAVSRLSQHAPVAALNLASRQKTGGLTEYQSRSLGIQEQRLARGDQITPYQSESLNIQQQRLDQGGPRAVEAIRRKLASGQQLSPAEERVYQDARTMSPVDRMLMRMGQGGGGLPTNTQAPNLPQPGGSNAGGDQQSQPSQQSLDYLSQNSNDPAVRQQFDDTFGPGAAERTLSGS